MERRRPPPEGLRTHRRAGEHALDDWLRGDSDLFQYRDEGLLRLFFSDLTDPEVALDNVRRMREWREEAVGLLPRAEIQPHAQEDVELGYRFPLRALEFGIAWLEAQAKWLRAEVELDSELDDG